MDRIKAGIIGCGAIARDKYLASLRELDRTDMLAFCDIELTRAQSAAHEFGAPGAKAYTDYRLLLELPLDVVYVCTPNRSHAPVSVAALDSGKHVMCEKPMALNGDEAAKMLEAAKRSGKLLTIGYQNRFRQDSQYLKQACASGMLGEVYFARANALRRRGVPTWGVFLNEYEQGGGPLIDIGSHALDLALWMMDNYRPRYAVGTVFHKLNRDTQTANLWGDWDPDLFMVEDSAFGFIVMENGATIILSASWALNTLEVGEGRVSLSGTRAGADMQDGLRINGVRFGRQYTERPDLGKGDDARQKPAVLEQEIFLKAVLGQGELCILPEQALTVSRILDAIYTSAKTGKPVCFE